MELRGLGQGDSPAIVGWAAVNIHIHIPRSAACMASVTCGSTPSRDAFDGFLISLHPLSNNMGVKFVCKIAATVCAADEGLERLKETAGLRRSPAQPSPPLADAKREIISTHPTR